MNSSVAFSAMKQVTILNRLKKDRVLMNLCQTASVGVGGRCAKKIEQAK